MRSLHPLEALLQDLPVFQAFYFFHGGGVDGSFLRVLRRLRYPVEDSEGARKRFVCQLVSGHFIGHIMAGRHEVEHPALSRIGGIEGAFVKLDTLAEALDETEAI